MAPMEVRLAPEDVEQMSRLPETCYLELEVNCNGAGKIKVWKKAFTLWDAPMEVLIDGFGIKRWHLNNTEEFIELLEILGNGLWVEGSDGPSGSLKDWSMELRLRADEQGRAKRDLVQGTILKVAIDKPKEDEVFLEGEELRFESIVEPSWLSGVTHAWSVTQGTCDPSTASSVDFETTLKSEGAIKVKLEVTVGGTTCEKLRTLEAVLPEVTKISWEDDHDLLEGTTGSSAITDPVWVKTLGGAVTKEEPGVYTAGVSAKAELEIEGSKSLSYSTSVEVRGEGVAGNDENFYFDNASFHNWTWSPGELQLDSSPLYASVNFYATLDVQWKYRVEDLSGGFGDWVDMNESAHELYTVLADPGYPEDIPHAGILYHACRWAANATVGGGVCDDILNNGFSAHYTWVANCNVLSSDFIRLIASVGIAGQQHRWRSKYFYPGGFPHVGAMVEQRTIRFTPVGGSADVIEWWWHQWAQAESQQRDPSAASSHAGSWGAYEDYLFTDYRECTDTNPTPYQTQWVTNQTGQASGCEVYPANCDYLSGPLAPWLGPDH